MSANNSMDKIQENVNDISSLLNLDVKTEHGELKEIFDETLTIPVYKVEGDNSIEKQNKLSKLLANYYSKYGVAGVHIFGILYGKELFDSDVNLKDLATNANISENYHAEINKARNVHKSLAELFKYSKKIEPQTVMNNKPSSSATSHISPEQIIYYGVPGCGKSHLIFEKLKTDYGITESNEDIQVMRTVFHPEYTNADFVGQILPKVVNGKTEFEFTPGPFTKILKKAMWDSANKYVLIVEEINRGNAAAIFGELFQLLDRIEDDQKVTKHEGSLNYYGKGWSDYFVMNSEINNYIRDSKDAYDQKAWDMNGIHFSANTGIRLPPNLSILATMNTSDQNVFTLDNAFQRRLDKVLVKNEFGNTDKEKVQRQSIIETTNCSWELFQTTINKRIGEAAQEAGLSSMEDKRLGCWFVKNKNSKISKEQFAGNVLKYLWDDAFKFNRESVFKAEFKNFEELSKAFLEDNKGLSVFTIPFVENE